MLFASRPWILGIAALAAAGGCGRSALREPSPRGEGGATSSSTGTTSASGGSGGSGGQGGSGGAPLCTGWEPTANWITKGFFPEQYSSLPQMVPISPSESTYHLGLLGRDETGATWVWGEDFEPWSAPLGSNNEIFDVFQGVGLLSEYALGPGRDADAYGLLVATQVQGKPGVRLFGGFTSDSWTTDMPGTPRPLFVARRVENVQKTLELLLGYEMTEGARRRLAVRIVSQPWGFPEHGQAAACADAPLTAKAVGTPGAFFFAVGSSRPVGGCDDPADAYGPPTRLQVTFYDQPLGMVLNPIAELDDGLVVEKVDLTLGEGALWVTYALVGDASTALLRVVRVGLTGGILSGPFDIAKIPRPAMFSATRMGSRLLVAALEKSGNGHPMVPMRALDTTGTVETLFTITPEAVSDVAIATEPGGKRIIAAMTRGTPDSKPGALITRFGCL